jgi:hypothetical protein
MTAMRKFKTDVTTTTDVVTTTPDTAFIGDRVVRVFGALCCPHCLRGQLRSTAMRDIGEGEYALTCQVCHRDTLTVTNT